MRDALTEAFFCGSTGSFEVEAQFSFIGFIGFILGFRAIGVIGFSVTGGALEV